MRARVTTFAIICVAALVGVSVFAPFIAPFSFETQDMNRILLGPNKINWFGTDELGRDLFSRIVFGARISFTVALLTSLFSLAIGTFYGAIAGYRGGWIDSLMMRVIDIVQALPPLVLMIFVSVIFNATMTIGNEEFRSVLGIIIALSLVAWVSVARLVRNQVLLLRQISYVQGARAAGAGFLGIFWRHIIPNIMGPVLVMFTYLVPSQILHESFLSFIGLGLQPPYSSWGVLANEGWRSFRTYPHLIVVPGLAIFITMLACQFLGDSLRDKLDPQTVRGPLRARARTTR